MFDSRFANIDENAKESTTVELAKIKQKLFVDEILNVKTDEFMPAKFNQYDIKENVANEKFIKELF